MIKYNTLSLQVFKQCYKQCFERELLIYKQPNFHHENILSFITSNAELLAIMLEYHPNGSLYHVLNDRPVSLGQFFDIAVSVTRGKRELSPTLYGYAYMCT